MPLTRLAPTKVAGVILKKRPSSIDNRILELEGKREFSYEDAYGGKLEDFDSATTENTNTNMSIGHEVTSQGSVESLSDDELLEPKDRRVTIMWGGVTECRTFKVTRSEMKMKGRGEGHNMTPEEWEEKMQHYGKEPLQPTPPTKNRLRNGDNTVPFALPEPIPFVSSPYCKIDSTARVIQSVLKNRKTPSSPRSLLPASALVHCCNIPRDKQSLRQIRRNDLNYITDAVASARAERVAAQRAQRSAEFEEQSLERMVSSLQIAVQCYKR